MGLSRITQIKPEVWKHMSADANECTFGTIRNSEDDRLDYVLAGIDQDEQIMGYMTCRELDSKTTYLAHGGACNPKYRGTSAVWQVYKAMIDWHRDRTSALHTWVENDNIGYIKVMFKAGFKIVGTKTVKGVTFLDGRLELQ